jgi:hypothetical protein
MTDSILKDLLAGGENSHVEFKRDTIRGEQLAREAVAGLSLWSTGRSVGGHALYKEQYLP